LGLFGKVDLGGPAFFFAERTGELRKIDEIERMVTPVLERHGCDLVLATMRHERGGLILRFLIERHGADPDGGAGVDHRLLALVSREIGALLDVEDVLTSHYNLEVSSPGIERPLVRIEDFARFAGREVSVSVSTPASGRRRLRGVLGPVIDGRFSIDTGDGAVVRVAHDDVVRANLVYDPRRIVAKAGDD